MPNYDDERYSPPAPVATVIVQSLDSGAALWKVSACCSTLTQISCAESVYGKEK